MSAPSPAAGHLLFGLLALQNHFVSRERLLEALSAWLGDRKTALIERLGLSEDEKQLVAKLVNRHVKHHSSPQKTLAALPLAPDLLTAIGQLRDPEIRSLLDSLDQTHSDSYDTIAPVPIPVATVATLVPPQMRYRTLRPHARGGLGEVSVARDEELDREVALKQIREPFVNLPESRARFHREAEVTAKLEHPGVVPVYGRGSHPDGRPYYAMRFVQGETLKDAIDRFHKDRDRDAAGRRLALRGLLERFVAVCDVIAYAHDRGVIHRDLKPANILLGDYGETILIDWGLARVLDRPDPYATTPVQQLRLSEGGDSAATEMGQVMGTPSYASPEQASGRVGEMKPTSDVFSLGAVLYQILTGQAPYVGKEVEAVLRLAQRAQFAPARKVAAHVPRPLEAVCNKAMKAAPAERYQSAKALADDVRRYLADEPVSADREPLQERLWRRARRHHALATTTAALVLVCGLALLIGLWAVNREKDQTAKARDEAVAAAKQAEQNQQRALEAEEEAKANLDRAEKNLELARKAIDESIKLALEDPLFQQPRMAAARKKLLEAALPFFEKVLALKPDDASLQGEHARLWQQVAYVNQALQRTKETIAAYRQARDLRRALAKSRPGDVESLRELAGVHNNLAILLHEQGKRDEAIDEYKESLQIREKLVKDRPDVPEHQKDLADTHNNLGVLLSSTEKSKEEGLKHHRAALTIQEELHRKYPTRAAYLRDLGSGHNNLGAVLDEVGEKEEAINAYRESIRLLESLVKKFPKDADYQVRLLRSRNNLASTLNERGQKKESAQEFDRAIEQGAKLLKEHPDDYEIAFEFSAVLAHAANLIREEGQKETALKLYDHARDLRKQLVKLFPEVHAYQEALARVNLDVGETLDGLGNRDGALVEYQSAISILSKLIAARTADADNTSRLARAYLKRGGVLAEMAKLQEALDALEKGMEQVDNLRKLSPRHPGVARNLSFGLTSRAEVRARLGQTRDADEDWERALALAPKEKRQEVSILRVHGRALAGDHVRSAAEADDVSQSSRLNGPSLLSLASSYSLDAAFAAKDTSLKAGERAKLADGYGASAVKLLKRAAAAGHFADPRRTSQLDADRDFDAIRERDDYREFRKTLKEAKE